MPTRFCDTYECSYGDLWSELVVLHSGGSRSRSPVVEHGPRAGGFRHTHLLVPRLFPRNDRPFSIIETVSDSTGDELKQPCPERGAPKRVPSGLQRPSEA